MAHFFIEKYMEEKEKIPKFETFWEQILPYQHILAISTSVEQHKNVPFFLHYIHFL